MAWYFWVLSIIGGLFLLIVFIYLVTKGARKRKYEEFLADISTWEIGDSIILKDNQYSLRELRTLARNNRLSAPELYKWNEHEVLITCGEKDDTHYLIGHSDIKQNRTDAWRIRYASMNAFMRKVDAITDVHTYINEHDEVVESKMKIYEKDGFIYIDGKMLQGMEKARLEVYRKYAEEEGNNFLLEGIQRELSKHK